MSLPNNSQGPARRRDEPLLGRIGRFGRSAMTMRARAAKAGSRTLAGWKQHVVDFDRLIRRSATRQDR